MTARLVPLGEVAELRSGVGFPKRFQGRADGDFPFAKVGDISAVARSGGRRLSGAANHVMSTDLHALRAKPFPPGTIAFAKIGEAIRQNFRAVAQVSILLDNNVMGAIPSDQVDPDYLFHFLASLDLYRFAQSTTVPSLRKSELARIAMPLPTIEEQRRIAAVLDAAEALRAKRRQSLAKLDSLTRSVFLDMFGDPRLKSKQLGFVPLADLLKLKSGQGLSAKAMRPGPHLVYGGNGVSGTHSEYMFEESKIVIGRVGVYCGCVHISKPRSWITDNALYVSWMSPHLSTTFLAAALELVNLNRFASQAAQPLISGGRIYPVAIPVPPLNAQQVFERKVRAIADHRSRLEEGSSKLSDLFASLQQRAFRGEL